MVYYRPEALEEALSLLDRERPALIAGGTDRFPAMVPGNARGALLDVTGIAGLGQIAEADDHLRIGAAVTLSQLVGTSLPPAFDGLKEAARQIGSVQIQNRATLVGNICNASPAADGVPPLLTLEAEVEIAGPRGLRRVRLEAFVTGNRRTCLDEAEMVTAILVPRAARGAAGAFVKLGSRAYLVISISMVSALVTLEDGRVSRARVAVGSCSVVAQGLPGLEARLTGLSAAEVERMAFDASDFYAPLSPISDVRGSAGYRRDVVSQLCARAVTEALKRAGG